MLCARCVAPGTCTVCGRKRSSRSFRMRDIRPSSRATALRWSLRPMPSRSGAQLAGHARVGIDNPGAQQPLARLARILLEPRAGASQAETVTPGVHVLEQPLFARTWQHRAEQYLQVADGVFLGIIATGILHEAGAPLGAHADE